MKRFTRILALVLSASALSACGATLGVVGVGSTGIDPDMQMHGPRTTAVTGRPAQAPATETAIAAPEAPRPGDPRPSN